MATKTYKKNEVIFQQGDSANCMYDIYFGSVGIYANYGEKDEKLLAKLSVDACFGEMGLIDQAPRSATAVALEKETVLRIITEDDFGAYFEERPAKVMTIMQQMSKRIRNLTGQYLEACRAVAETVESENTGKKSGWLDKYLSRFLEDYDVAARTMDVMDSSALPYNFHLRRMD